jgi:hypothetical protein
MPAVELRRPRLLGAVCVFAGPAPRACRTAAGALRSPGGLTRPQVYSPSPAARRGVPLQLREDHRGVALDHTPDVVEVRCRRCDVLSAADLAVGEEPCDLEAREWAATERIQSDCPHHPDAFAVDS